MKKFIALVLCALMVLGALTACGGNNDTPAAPSNPGSGTTTNNNEPAPEGGDSAGLPEITAGMCEGAVILTSIGQSADADVVSTLCQRAGIDVYANNTIAADSVTDQYKTIIMAVGGSSKGLGAAGIDADQELARADALINRCHDLGIKIVAMHTGGSARRGTLSDSFINPVFDAADVAIVIKEGDSDNLMSGILSANSTPSAYLDSAADAIGVLQTMFGA